MQLQAEEKKKATKLFVSSIRSPATKKKYMFYIQKYFDFVNTKLGKDNKNDEADLFNKL